MCQSFSGKSLCVVKSSLWWHRAERHNHRNFDGLQPQQSSPNQVHAVPYSQPECSVYWGNGCCRVLLETRVFLFDRKETLASGTGPQLARIIECVFIYILSAPVPSAPARLQLYIGTTCLSLLARCRCIMLRSARCCFSLHCFCFGCAGSDKSTEEVHSV